MKNRVRSVQVGDVTIAVDDLGSDRDPAVVMSMGATASMLGWPDELPSMLAKHGFRVVRYDHRDTGLSTTWPLGEARYHIEDMLADLIGALDALGLQAVHLVGMSLGGYLAQAAAVRHPDRVETLTLIASEPLGWDGADLPGIDARFLAHFGKLAKLDWDLDHDVEAFLVEGARLCAAISRPFDEVGARHAARAVLERSPSLSSAYNHGTVDTRDDWHGAFRRIERPVLVVHGDEDPILPLPNGEALAAGIHGAQLNVLRGVGHELPPRVVQEVSTAIVTFIASHGLTPRR
jgi:pimeloyl-ACP methyl ester carboxylesterase